MLHCIRIHAYRKKKGNKDRIKEIKKEVKREGHKTIGGIPKREKKMKG